VIVPLAVARALPEFDLGVRLLACPAVLWNYVGNRSGTGPFFGQTANQVAPAQAENMDLSPSVARDGPSSVNAYIASCPTHRSDCDATLGCLADPEHCPCGTSSPQPAEVLQQVH